MFASSQEMGGLTLQQGIFFFDKHAFAVDLVVCMTKKFGFFHVFCFIRA